METIHAVLRKLALDDLREWAGSKILSRGQSYLKNVKGLSYLEDGTLTAWVSGSDLYATSVCLSTDGDFDYSCTCPYDWGPCKHAVAVVLAAAEQLKQKKEIPLLNHNDDLYQALFDDADEDDTDDDDWFDDDEDAEPATEPPTKGTQATTGLHRILDGMGKDELIRVIKEAAARYPEIERDLLESKQFADGKVNTLVRSLQREIGKLTSETAWYNSWRGEGNIPDYSHVQSQLHALLDSGHADQVIRLGEELWTKGIEQVGQSNDEGETADEITACMNIVLQAVPCSSMSSADQLLWVINRALKDEYSLLDSAASILENTKYTRDTWHTVADALEGRLNSMKQPAAVTFSSRYHRNRVMNMLVDAYTRSGKPEKVIPLLEKEADVGQCYEALVDALRAAGEIDKAKQWCIRGFERTLKSAPGIASALQGRLRQLAEKEKRYDLVSAYRAEDFFDRASRQTYSELRKAAEKAKVWPEVRASVLSYLETGRRPEQAEPSKNSAWPLPRPEVVRPHDKAAAKFSKFPDLDMLIDIAIMEKRFDDVVGLYRELRKIKRWSWETDKAVADAVAASHPQLAVDIWKAIVDSLIAQVKPRAYEEAAGYLRRINKVYQQNQQISEWQSLISELQRVHKAKRRLMEVLAALSGKKILD
jgi:uncharacterized Zn finger protein